MNTLQILKQARDIITEPENWTQNYPAKNAEGFGVSPIDPSATCWCATGALRKVLEEFYGPDSVFHMGHLRDSIAELRDLTPDPYIDIEDLNDCTNHAAVLAVFDRAIAKLESGK